MEILQTYDLTGCAHSAAALAGCDPKTVRWHVERWDRGFAGHRARPAERLIDPFVDKVESPHRPRPLTDQVRNLRTLLNVGSLSGLNDLCWGTMGARDVARHCERLASDEMETRRSAAVSPP
jgi:hypothetical protein